MAHVGHASTHRKLPWMDHPRAVLIASVIGLVIAMAGVVLNHLTGSEALRAVCAGLIAGIPYMLLGKWHMRVRLESIAGDVLKPFLSQIANSRMSLPRIMSVGWLVFSLGIVQNMHALRVTAWGMWLASAILLYPEQKALWRRIRELAGVGDDLHEAS